MTALAPILALSLLLGSISWLVAPTQALAALDPSLQGKIEAACKSGIKPGHKDRETLTQICECLAQAHFISAKAEPDESEGKLQLQWALEFHGERDNKKSQKMLNDEDGFGEFEIQAAERCERKAKRKKK